MIEPEGVRKIAIVLPDMIGTTVCAWPAVQIIRAAFPRAIVQLLGFGPVSRFLLDEVGGGDDLFLLDLPLDPGALTRALGGGPSALPPPDLAFDFLGTKESLGALAAGGVKELVGWPDRQGRVTLPVQPPSQKHQLAVQDYLDFVLAVGVPAPFSPPRLTASTATRARADGWLEERGVSPAETLFVLGVGGGNSRKRWPLEHYLDLEEALRPRGRSVYFLGPQEAEIEDRLRSTTGERIIAASLPLDLAKGLLARARLAVCNDHSMMHLAAALEVPTLGVFLASDPEEWFPYPAPSSYVIGPPLDCRPCYRADCDPWSCNNPALPAEVRRWVDRVDFFG